MKMKARLLLGVGVLSIIIILASCHLDPRVTPGSDPDNLWVCSERDIWFVECDEEAEGAAIGQIVNGEEAIKIEMCWGPGPRFDIWRYPGNKYGDRLVRGTCEFSKDEGTVWVIEDEGNVLDGAETLTFVRQESERQGDGSSVLIKYKKSDEKR